MNNTIRKLLRYEQILTQIIIIKQSQARHTINNYKDSRFKEISVTDPQLFRSKLLFQILLRV